MNTANPGVPFAQYRQRRAGVRLTCLDCIARRDLPLEAVIARLEARGVGGHTDVRELGGLVRALCPGCGWFRFETTPAFPAGKGAGRPVR